MAQVLNKTDSSSDVDESGNKEIFKPYRYVNIQKSLPVPVILCDSGILC